MYTKYDCKCVFCSVAFVSSLFLVFRSRWTWVQMFVSCEYMCKNDQKKP